MLSCPFQGQFVIRRLELGTINLFTTYQVSMFTHYEDMKGDEQCKNWGGLKVMGHPMSLETSPYDFLFDFNRNNASTVFEL